ncbi:DUF6722 family protein [Hydrogenivirga sp. 128-5-R1-1]|uniref:DUF6722 family protein n=1 Tax=Hydrogenivirga sp. 128-5-R1-1 TaxID=392423 RepID=UPI00015F3A11|nr:DUF6722 family protein [Hydrogenivirga sp. 128-5-R1-1]EDP75057.1 hypothetical protein HG1285_14354 [Hydrogenivirga sp. 128-5-R1-1]
MDIRGETLKETGKLFYDLAKISFGLGLLLPVFRGKVSLYGALFALSSALVFFVIGLILINRGVGDG